MPAKGAATAISIFMASSTTSRSPASTRWPGFDGDVPDAGGDGRGDGAAAFGDGVFGARGSGDVRRFAVGVQAGCGPAFALGQEGLLLGALEAGGIGFDGVEEGVVIAQAEILGLDAEGIAAVRERVADFEELFGGDRVEADLVEEAQQPGRVGAVRVPHLQGAADELVAAGTFHAVDAEIGAADADGVFGRPGARRIVLGGDQAMARIDGGGDGRAEIDVAQAEHQIVGVEDDAVDVVDGGEAVDAADEFDVAGAPGRVGAHGLGVLADGELGGGIVPGERQVDDARGDDDVVEVGDAALDGIERVEQGLAGEAAAVVVDVEGADAGSDVDDAGEAFGAQAGFEGVDAEAQVEVEDVGAVFDEQVFVAVGADDAVEGLWADCRERALRAMGAAGI